MAPPSPPTITIADQVGVEPVPVESSPGPGKEGEGEFTFTSTSLPIRMGNRLPIAYGGCAISVAVHAAARAAVPEATHRLYSVVGHFLGPAVTDQPFRCTVTRTRDTRSFATRRVRVSQLQPQRRKEAGGRSDGGDGHGEPKPTLQERVCLELIADFHVVEDALMTFSAPPSRPYAAPPTTAAQSSSSSSSSSPAATCPTRQELEEELTRAGHLRDAARETPREFATMYDGHDRYFEMRFCREGMSGQNLGWARHVATDQDAVPLTARSSAEWYRARPVLNSPDSSSSSRNSGEEGRGQGRTLETHGEHCAALAFLMDGGLAFLPLVHSHRGFADAGAASSLDFALRIMTPDVDMRRWHVRERVAHAAGAGRSYGEGRLFDERGRLVASMTQQGILRPPPPPDQNKRKEKEKRREKAVL